MGLQTSPAQNVADCVLVCEAASLQSSVFSHTPVEGRCACLASSQWRRWEIDRHFCKPLDRRNILLRPAKKKKKETVQSRRKQRNKRLIIRNMFTPPPPPPSTASKVFPAVCQLFHLCLLFEIVLSADHLKSSNFYSTWLLPIIFSYIIGKLENWRFGA